MIMEWIVEIDEDKSIMDAKWVKELVRCKDCKHNQGNACDYSSVWTRPNGFCQWGERKDDAPTADPVKHGAKMDEVEDEID